MDYDALAKQFGGSPVDATPGNLDDLAKRLGGTLVKDTEPSIVSRAGAAFQRGLEQVPEAISGIGLGLKSAVGMKEAAGRQAEEIRQEGLKEQVIQGLTFEELQKIYGEKGLIEALKKAPAYVVEQVLQSAPSMAGPLAAGAGAAAISGPAAPIVGPLVGVGTYGLQQFGQFMRRQAEEGATGETLEPGKAALAAAVTAPIGYFADRLLIGVNKIPEKILGEQVAAELGKRAGVRAATGATVGVIAEAPTEVLEQMAERWQAGLPLKDENAIREYKEAAAGAAAFGGVGGAAAGALSRPKVTPPEAPPPAAEERKPEPEVAAPAVEPTIEPTVSLTGRTGAQLLQDQIRGEQNIGLMDAARVRGEEQEAIREQERQAKEKEQARLDQEERDRQAALLASQERARGLGLEGNAAANAQLLEEGRRRAAEAEKQRIKEEADRVKNLEAQKEAERKDIESTVFSTDPLINARRQQTAMAEWEQKYGVKPAVPVEAPTVEAPPVAKPQAPSFKQEALKIADQMEGFGEKSFADGIRLAANKNLVTEKSMDFYRQRLAEKQKLTGQGAAQQSEIKNVDTFFTGPKNRSEPAEKVALNTVRNSRPEFKSMLDSVSESMQGITDIINKSGLKVDDVNATHAQNLQELKNVFSSLAGSTKRFLTEGYRVANKDKRADQAKLDKAVAQLSEQINAANELIAAPEGRVQPEFVEATPIQGEAAPRPPEVVEAEGAVERGEAAARKARRESPSLWTALRYSLTGKEVKDISPEFNFKQLQGEPGTDLSTLVDNGTLNDFLPPKMRKDSASYDEQESVEYLKDKLRSGNYLTHDAELEIRTIFDSVENAEGLINQYLDEKDVNLLLQEIADEQRAANEPVTATVPEDEGRAAETGPAETEGLEAAARAPVEVNPEEQRIQDELQGKNLLQVSQWAVDNAPNNFVRVIAEKVQRRLREMQRRGVQFEFKIHTGPGREKRMRDCLGVTRLSWGKTPGATGTKIAIELNGVPYKENQRGYPSGVNYSTIMHELLHAASRAQLKFLGKNDPLVNQLKDLFDKVKKQVEIDRKAGTLPAVIQDFVDGRNNALDNIDEMVSWGLTDEGMQQYLDNVEVGKKSAFTRLIELIREVIGVGKPFETALEKLARTTEDILDVNIRELEGGITSVGISYGPGKARRPTTTGEVLMQKEGAESGASMFNQKEIDKERTPAYKGRSKLIEMPIDDFLGLAEEGFASYKEKDIKELVSKGEKFSSLPFLMIDENGNVEGHEGRHRARALKEAGYKTMPVLLRSSNIRWSEQSDPSRFDYIEKWPTRLRAEKNAKDPSFSVPFPVTREEAAASYDADGKEELPSAVKTAKAVVQKALQPKPSKNVVGLPADLQAGLDKVFGPHKKQTIVDKIEGAKDRFWQRLAQGIADQYRTIKEYSEDAYIMARMSKTIDGALEGLMFHGEVFNDGGALNVKPGSKGMLEILKPLGNEVENYMRWVALNREVQLVASERNPSIDPELVRRRHELVQGTLNGKPRAEVYAGVLKEMNKLNSSVLKVALDTGLIDKDGYDRFSRDIFYIPFYKAMEDGDVSGAKTAAGLTRQEFSKMLKGGEREFSDLMENTLRNWSHILSASMKNQAAKASLDAAEKVNAAERLEKNEKGAVRVMEDGQPVYYAVTDPLLLDAITSIGYMGPKSKILDVARDFKNLLQFGVTMSPAFKIRNLIRDSVSAMAISDLKKNPVANVIEGMNLTDKNNPYYISALAGGGIFNFGSAYEGQQAKLIKRLLDMGVEDKHILDSPDKIKNALKIAWGKYQELGNKSEAANRMALYKQMRDKGMSHLEATYYARDLLDFSMQGSFPAFRLLTQVVPFLNARIQGLYKLGRDGINPTVRVIYNTATGKPIEGSDKVRAQSFTIVTSAVGLASIAMYAAFGDDEEFKKRDDWDRDNFWWFRLPGMDYAFRIPKPFEIGAFGTLVERTLDQIYDQGAEGKDFVKALERMATDTFAFNLPQAIKPLVDIYANRDSFTGSPIESAGMERLSKAERMTDSTSPLAKALGGVANVFLPEKMELSPVQTEYMIKGYLGWMGAQASWLSHYAVLPFKEGTKPDNKWTDTLSAGFVRTLPATQARYVNAFYENSKEIGQAYADMRHYASLGDSKKVEEIIAEKGDKIAMAKFYDKTAKQMSGVRKAIQAITEDKIMDGAQKRVEIDRLKLIIGELAQQAEMARKSVRK